MASKFYAVFFVQECGLSPIYSSLLSILAPLSVSAFSAAVNRFGRLCDPFSITLVTKALDFGLLTAMACVPAGQRTRDALVLLHLLRFGVANSSRPQLRSMMMNHVDKVPPQFPTKNMKIYNVEYLGRLSK
jgi:hypothetical protein